MSAGKGPRSKFTLRMPRVLHRRLAAAALAAGMDLNSWIEKCLREEVERE